MAQTQSFKSHTRWDPMFHFIILPVLIANIILCIVFYIHHRPLLSYTGIWLIVLSLVLFMIAGKSRGYALKNQDRVIRLEEKSRLASLVSASELVELESLNMRQYIGLRFASNTELPDLARRAIRENLTEKQIKQAIVAWRPDHDRV